jgi:CheY-like chemotaxis protein
MTLRYEIITGDNGLEGIQEAIRENPDLIILDIMMPNMDGFEVCKVLRAILRRVISRSFSFQQRRGLICGSKV